MSKFTSEMVDDLSEKLLIGLTKEENEMVLNEFEEIDKTISLINKIPNLQSVEPMSFCLDDFIYELRSDEVKKSVDIEELLHNCDDYVGREVKVPKVVNDNV